MVLTLVVCYFSAGMSGFAGVSNNLGQLYVFASLSIVVVCMHVAVVCLCFTFYI
jgi:hypothetical protein